MHRLIRALIFTALSGSAAVSFRCAAGPSLGELASHFEYDRNIPLDVREMSVEARDGITVHDLSYTSPLGGRVPAYLVVPKSKGPFAAILYGHWMMHGSPLMNRREFLEEAVIMAQAGAVALLIDTPLVRPGFVEEKDLLKGAVQTSKAVQQQVVDFRRGLDYLSTRSDIDPHRVAYVGHSFDAHVGAILAGVEKRIQLFVLMAGSYADAENTFQSKDPTILSIRKQLGDEQIRAYFQEYAWDDPVYYLPHSGPASIFLQFGSKDHPRDQDIRAYDRFGLPKRIEFYDAGHALNAAATHDRILWLVKRLQLQQDAKPNLDKIPELK